MCKANSVYNNLWGLLLLRYSYCFAILAREIASLQEAISQLCFFRPWPQYGSVACIYMMSAWWMYQKMQTPA